MNARKAGCTQQTAAAKAGFSERSGGRIETGVHQPHKGQPRDWRTRADPLAEVWNSELEPMLQREPKLEAMTLFEYLQEHYPGQYQNVLRTVQRRVSEWKAQHGVPPELMFQLRHNPGEMGLSDFTQLKGVTITIAGMPYEHLLYHYRLAYSGWQYVQIIEGGESFIALAEGLQNALFACGGVPKEHRTDSLTAAYHNSGGKHKLTQRYAALCAHYQIRSSRNNTGVAHENGAIESPHGYFKRRLVQQLYLRGSFDFATIAEYAAFIRVVVEKLNAKCSQKFTIEQSQLQPLPKYRFADYEILSVRVSCRATVDLKSVLYTVPERLVGRQLTVHLYHNRWVGYLGQQTVVEQPRLSSARTGTGRRVRAINYRHLVEGLRKKPRALLYCTWQQEILPNDQYRAIWQQMLDTFERDSAARIMVEALYIAATQDKETAVGEYLQTQLAANGLSLTALQQHFQLASVLPPPEVAVSQHPLSSYDQLFAYEHLNAPAATHANPACSSGESLRELEHSSQKPQTLSHAPPLAETRTTSHPGELELCSVPLGIERTRSQQTLSSSHCTSDKRSTTAGGQVDEQFRLYPLPHAQPGCGDEFGARHQLGQHRQQLPDFRTFGDWENSSSHWRCPMHGRVGQTGQVLCCHRTGADPATSQTQSQLTSHVGQT